MATTKKQWQSVGWTDGALTRVEQRIFGVEEESSVMKAHYVTTQTWEEHMLGSNLMISFHHLY